MQALGDTALWDIAEQQLAEALNEFAGTQREVAVTATP